MADPQDVLNSNGPWEPEGYTNTAWGGQGVDPSIKYTGGFTAPDQYGIPSPKDPQAWQDYLRARHNSTGQAQAVNRYQNMAAASMGRYAPDIDYSGAQEYDTAANDAQNMGNGVRGDQQDSLAMARAAAMGQTPSQAEILGRNLMGQSLQGQLAGAASARGGAMAQAAAMRNAQNGAAAFQQQGMNSLDAMRAQEMATARDQYGQQAYGIRAQDYTLAQQNMMQAAEMAKRQQVQGALDMQQRGLNDAREQYYEGLGWNTNNAMLNAGMGQSAQAQQNMQFQQQMEMQRQQQEQQFYASLASGGSTMMAGWMAGRADGGPVAPGQPVLVGEQGPEVIVPASAIAEPPKASATGVIEQSPADRVRTESNMLVRDTPMWTAVSPALGLGAAGAAVLNQGEGLGRDAVAIVRPEGALAAPPPDPNKRDERRMTMANRVASLVAPIMPAAALGANLAGLWSGTRAVQQRASGGPVQPGQPVLVGERGPEVIYPQQAGMVLPATHPVSQQVARRQMSLSDVARLRQQADDIERDLARRKAQPPAIAPQSMAAPAPAPTMGQVALMGGRQDPYATYNTPTWGARLYGGREDPYATASMGDAAMPRNWTHDGEGNLVPPPNPRAIELISGGRRMAPAGGSQDPYDSSTATAALEQYR